MHRCVRVKFRDSPAHRRSEVILTANDAKLPIRLITTIYFIKISWTEWSFAATGTFKPIGTNCRRKAVLGCPQWREARLIS